MRDSIALTGTQVARRCPACGRVSAGSERCLHCWRDIAAIPPLPQEEAESALKVEARLARRLDRRPLFPRALGYAALAVVAIFLAWWTYAAFFKDVPRPAPPSSTARNAGTAGWSTQDGDNRGTRSTHATAHLGGSEAWRVALGSPAATAAVADGRLVVVPLRDGRLTAVEATTGKMLWTVALTLDNPPLSAPVIAGDRVYLAQREGLLLALSMADGREVWRSERVADSFESSPLVVDGVVYANSPTAVFAFDAETGRPLWHRDFDVAFANVAPVVEGNYLVVAASSKAAVFDRETGEQVYFASFSRSRPSSVTIRDGKVLALYGRNAAMFDASWQHPWWHGVINRGLGGETIRSFWFRMYLYGMAPAVPTEPAIWRSNSLPARALAAASNSDLVVAASRDGAVTAVRWADGQQAWTARIGPLVTAPIITADGVLLVEEGRLLLLDLATGAPRAEREIEGTVGAIPTEAATYVTTASGDLFAIR